MRSFGAFFTIGGMLLWLCSGLAQAREHPLERPVGRGRHPVDMVGTAARTRADYVGAERFKAETLLNIEPWGARGLVGRGIEDVVGEVGQSPFATGEMVGWSTWRSERRVGRETFRAEDVVTMEKFRSEETVEQADREQADVVAHEKWRAEQMTGRTPFAEEESVAQQPFSPEELTAIEPWRAETHVGRERFEALSPVAQDRFTLENTVAQGLEQEMGVVTNTERRPERLTARELKARVGFVAEERFRDEAVVTTERSYWSGEN